MSVFLRFCTHCVPLLASASVLTGVVGCGSLNDASNRAASVVTPYRPEVVQGNFVSKEQVEYLQVGITRQQVREVLGSPLVTSVFHADRWDYVFTIRRQGIEAQSRKLSVFFKDDLLQKFEGDAMPSEADFVKSLDTQRTLGKVPSLEAADAVLTEFNAKNSPQTQQNRAQAATESIAPRTTPYPPLEDGASATPAR
jgi:outer membrane protein assembly factor BamE